MIRVAKSLKMTRKLEAAEQIVGVVITLRMTSTRPGCDAIDLYTLF